MSGTTFKNPAKRVTNSGVAVCWLHTRQTIEPICFVTVCDLVPNQNRKCNGFLGSDKTKKWSAL